jgi:GNAT superfamily N-acetyltransferase
MMPSPQSVVVRELPIAELSQLEDCAREFYAASRFLKRFDMELFQTVWTGLVSSGTGVVFVLTNAAGEIQGTLGGVAVPDIYSGDPIATEFFWFVRPGARGRGLDLLRAFEQWARAKGCVQLRMARLLDVMPERLDRIYRRLGFEAVEVNYHKELL